MAYGHLRKTVRDRVEGETIRRSGATSQGKPQQDLTRNAAPKEAVQYVYRQLKQGVPPNELQNDLVGRGFAAEVADSYIDLVLKTMFKGKGTKG